MNKKELMVVSAGVIAAGVSLRIEVTEYRLRHAKIRGSVRIAVISDLHCRRFGKKQKWIKEKIDMIRPDLVIIPGDLFDVDRDFGISFELIEQLKEYPVYFTSGNHDSYLTEIAQLRRKLKAMGVHVLEDNGEIVTVNDTPLEIYGLSDHGREAVFAKDMMEKAYQSDHYRILISHRPNYQKFYCSAAVDLIISGHVHGGQFRIPFINKGIIGPGWEFLPKYAKGVHDMNGSKMVVSRGLASGIPFLPRLYNNPEIVVIELMNE